ncbi:helix-hairpin-helix domain-containing protein [Clostridium estertheticum]|uniref:helix-hairpin-helix domain-containing protein n=1 Tax=Clostridium estertheticum TaxID=238834 RepID=UPI001CF336C3|nr:helix-hairpin-helix domain-containing protein [Clostridium estertheticum]MCB2306573.1 helix-hairpin-helix domain-containing protein [Clostridium estertheticum]MCB2345161.1 helix-hairpin-helix domain-containing protein [Clostridium estertheticum]MCB2350065.1 helix-hairpin-helix domain-containing protein [Clostridium estertheticum]WAG44342.1 helix-hairpin-helix domain-containing protein [Clostridium estertheticum]
MKNKEKIIGSIAILCISIIFIIIGFVLSGAKGTTKTSDYKDVFIETDKTSQKSNKGEVKASVPQKAEDSNVKSEESIIKVDIKGAVKSPGVYEIKKGSRVTDLIKLAGGGTKDADLNATNLSKKLNDEDCIVINKNGEVNKTQMPNGSTPNSSTTNPTKSSTVSSSDNKGKGGVININTASIEELMTLTGIGEAKANIIIDYRKQNGGFKSVDELTKVGGIGEKTLSKFVDKIDIK